MRGLAAGWLALLAGWLALMACMPAQAQMETERQKATVPSLNLAELAGRPMILIDTTPLKTRGVQQFDRADMNTTLERALGNSNELAAARSRAGAQRYQVDVARGALLPRLDARINGGREISRPGSVIDPDTRTAVPYSNHGRGDTTALMRQSLIDVGAIRELNRQQWLAAAGDADVTTARDQVAQDASTAHLDLLQFSLNLDFAREYQAELEKLYTFVNNRSEAGGVTPAEAERVKARAINARSSVIEAMGTLESALITYRRLVGAIPLTMPANDVVTPRALPDVLTAMEVARQNSPALRQLRETSRAVEAEADVARARLLPKLELEFGNYRTRNAGGTPGTTNDTRAMLVLSMNLLNGGADMALARSILARLDDVRFRLADAERKLDEALMITFNTMDAVNRRASSVREEFIANRRVVVAFGDQLVSGNRQLLDVLDAQQRLFQSRSELLRLTVLEANLAVQAVRLMGGLSEPLSAPNGPATPVSEDPTGESKPPAAPPKKRWGLLSRPVMDPADPFDPVRAATWAGEEPPEPVAAAAPAPVVPQPTPPVAAATRARSPAPLAAAAQPAARPDLVARAGPPPGKVALAVGCDRALPSSVDRPCPRDMNDAATDAPTRAVPVAYAYAPPRGADDTPRMRPAGLSVVRAVPAAVATSTAATVVALAAPAPLPDRLAAAPATVPRLTIVDAGAKQWVDGGLAAGSQVARYVRLMVRDQDSWADAGSRSRPRAA